MCVEMGQHKKGGLQEGQNVVTSEKREILKKNL